MEDGRGWIEVSMYAYANCPVCKQEIDMREKPLETTITSDEICRSECVKCGNCDTVLFTVIVGPR